MTFRITQLARPLYFIPLLLAVVALPKTAFSQEYTPVTRLGSGESICVGGITTGEELQQVFANDSETISQILADANWSGDQADLDAAIAAGDFVEKSYAPGTQLQWFAARQEGVGVALPYREWQGAEPFAGFEVQITSNCQVHTLVIPKLCCNLSLISAEPEPVPAPSVNVSTTDDMTTICTEPGNTVSVTGPDGTSDVTLNNDGCWSGVLGVGDHEINATNPYCSGAATQQGHTIAAPVAIAPPPAKTLIPFIGFFAGSEDRERYEPHWDMDMEDASVAVGFKAGLMKFLSDDLAVFGQVGLLNRRSINEGNLYPKSSLVIDFGIDKIIHNNAFIGGGVGLWNVDDSDYDDESYFIHGGKNIGASNTQWYLEGRIFGDDTSNISTNKMITAGIRHLFK